VAEGGLEKMATLTPDIVLSDIRMPQVSGVEMLAAARAHDPEVPVILMTAQATLQSAMQAVNEGAFYYIQKPFRNDELLAILRRAAEHRARCAWRTRRSSRRFAGAIARTARAPIGQAIAPGSTCCGWPRRWRPRSPRCSSPGESGTGKEVIARYIHDLSARADARSSPSTAARCPSRCSRANSSAT
jgi:two-component system, NtrC family, response regulator HydG